MGPCGARSTCAHGRVAVATDGVCADHLDSDRIEGLVCIGVDEISYRRHHRYLTSVADHTTGAIVERVSAERLDDARLEGLVCIGVDEISYRRHHRYLTTVADHASGAIVWCSPGRNSATLQAFFDELGPRKDSIRGGCPVFCV